MEELGRPLPSDDFKQAGSVPFKWEIQPGIPNPSFPSSSSSPPHRTLRPPPPGPSTIFSSFSGALTPPSRSRTLTRPSPSRTPSSSSSRSSSSLSLPSPSLRRRRLQSAPIALGCFFLRRLRRRPRSDGSISTRSVSSGRLSLPGRPFDTVSEIGTPVRAYASSPLLSPFSAAGESPLLAGRSLSSVGDSPRYTCVSPRAFSSFRESPSPLPSYHSSPYASRTTAPSRNDLEWATYGLF